MTEQDKELAEQAGFWQEHTNTWMCTGEAIKNFADLIRADERERIKAANAPEIERINTYIKKLEDCIRARGNT